MSTSTSARLSDKEFKQRVDALSKHDFFSTDNTAEVEHDESYTNLSTSVKFRTQALRKLQLDELQAKAEYEEQCLVLQQQYYDRLQSSFTKRSEIVNGDVQPEGKDQLTRVVDDDEYTPSSKNGIPNFWLTVLQNCEMSSGWIEEHDEPLLKCITDITCKINNESDSSKEVLPPPYSETADTDIADTGKGDSAQKSVLLSTTSIPTGFTLSFEFGPNEYISNTVLTKKYEFCTKPGAEDQNPFEYEGASLKNAKGCEINWLSKEKQLTKKNVKKKQRNAKTGQTREVLKQADQDSFFAFFEKVPEVNLLNDDDETKMDLLMDIEYDCELGEYFKDKLIPNAVLFFTNEYVDPEVESDEEEDVDESDSDENSDENGLTEEEDVEQRENPECKQQ